MTSQRRTIFWASVGLVVAIGVLGILHATTFDPAPIKAELERRLADLNGIPAEEAIRKDALAEELLANEAYKNHARALYLQVERAHPRLHDLMQLEREAQKAVPPFLARCKDLSQVSGADLKVMFDEARSLLNNYGTTRYGKALVKAQAEVKAKLEAAPAMVTPSEVMELTRRVTQLLGEGRFSQALDLVVKFQQRPGAPEHQAKIQVLMESIRTKAAAAMQAVREKATLSHGRGDKTGAVELIERSLPDFKGLPKETEALESLRRKLLTLR